MRGFQMTGALLQKESSFVLQTSIFFSILVVEIALRSKQNTINIATKRILNAFKKN